MWYTLQQYIPHILYRPGHLVKSWSMTHMYKLQALYPLSTAACGGQVAGASIYYTASIGSVVQGGMWWTGGSVYHLQPIGTRVQGPPQYTISAGSTTSSSHVHPPDVGRQGTNLLPIFGYFFIFYDKGSIKKRLMNLI